MQGYYRNEEATREVLRDGWFHTGDFGFFDAEGFLHINGRKKNVIIARNGENVFPEELEEHVHRLPYVLECVVYGEKVDGDEMIAVMIVPDADAIHDHAARTGDRVTDEFIDRLLNAEIRSLNGSLPVHKQIRKVVLRETEFEKTTTQKIKRYLVHDEDSTH